MNNSEIEPVIKRGGSAFRGIGLNNNRPLSRLNDRDRVKVVSLSDWCRGNFISKRTGRELIKRKLLIGFRRHHIWWVTVNSECLSELLNYLGMEQLLFDADNS